jgi:hypothetical protein
LDHKVDPYAYVVSANIKRRHLSTEQKRDLIAALLKATPDKSDRQIAATVKASPTTVGTVRAGMETAGDVSKLDTRRDTKGRQQPAKRTRRTDECSTCGCHVSECACYDSEPPAPDDIGPNSAGEVARLNARIAELESENQRLTFATKSTVPQEPTRTQLTNKVMEIVGARDVVTRRDSLDDLPRGLALSEGAREAAILTLAARSHDFEFEAVMKALDALSKVTDIVWSPAKPIARASLG